MTLALHLWYDVIVGMKLKGMLYLLEIKPMKDATEAAIKVLVNLAISNVRSDDAMKYAQAALNLAHVLATIDNIKG